MQTDSGPFTFNKRSGYRLSITSGIFGTTWEPMRPQAGQWALSYPTRVRGLKLWNTMVWGLVVKSHPKRVHGLKSRFSLTYSTVNLSHPTRVRGLKYYNHLSTMIRCIAPHRCVDWNQVKIAPRTGTWIEINRSNRTNGIWLVASNMGAWIEIRREQICAECPTVAPTWVRGLKPLQERNIWTPSQSCRKARGSK